ncbi:MAG: cupin domain-containing protein [Pseudonocardiaceae bacterium]
MTSQNATSGQRVASPFVVLPGEGETVRGPAGGPTTVKARAETTGGTVTALENVVAPGQGPSLHLHIREDEMYYVLEGLLHFQAGACTFDAPTGSFVFIPRGTPHYFQNVGKDPARILVMFTPAGMERFFEGQAALPPGSPDPAAYRAIADSAWMEILGPPMAATQDGR